MKQPPFFRILKELGLYTNWIKERKKHLKIIGKRDIRGSIYDDLTPHFHVCIARSFAWFNSQFNTMWAELAVTAQNFKYSLSEEILKHPEEMNELKRIVEKYIKK